ncbi:hypothetical protein, partial [Streptomyces sp. NRRL S-241]|uniref:hypothetical protein n=1 Tax=Streptomyces sp. NRRL S-241 TaxID=1463896 RepID=UPI00131B394D
VGLGGPGSDTVEAAEGFHPALPLQLREQGRRRHAASKFARGPDYPALGAPRAGPAITELQDIAVLAQTAASALGFTAQPVLGLFARMAPTFELVRHIGATQRNGEIQEESQLVNSIQWLRLTHGKNPLMEEFWNP